MKMLPDKHSTVTYWSMELEDIFLILAFANFV